MTNRQAPGRLASVTPALGIGLAVVVALVGGLLADAIAPRGPVTTLQGLGVMAIAGLVGLAGGCLARTRWVLLPQLLAYAVAVELGRRGLAVPSLDVRFDNVYGIIAFVITRGIDGILLAPADDHRRPARARALGRRLTGTTPSSRRTGRSGRSLVGAATSAWWSSSAWPASTPPVLGPTAPRFRAASPSSRPYALGGTDQAVMIRAADPDKPVLLYLSGGPGQSDLAARPRPERRLGR